MRELKRDEMLKIEGGASGAVVAIIIGAIVSFFSSVLYGYSNPKKCNR